LIATPPISVSKVFGSEKHVASEPVTEFTRWTCVRCGTCCTEEMAPGWLECMLDARGLETVNGDCPMFCHDSRTCLDYPNRFPACRGFPFTLKRRGDRFYLHIHSKCHGLGIGDRVNIRSRLMTLLKSVKSEFGLDFRCDLGDDDPENGVHLILVGGERE